MAPMSTRSRLAHSTDQFERGRSDDRVVAYGIYDLARSLEVAEHLLLRPAVHLVGPALPDLPDICCFQPLSPAEGVEIARE